MVEAADSTGIVEAGIMVDFAEDMAITEDAIGDDLMYLNEQ